MLKGVGDLDKGKKLGGMGKEGKGTPSKYSGYWWA